MRTIGLRSQESAIWNPELRVVCLLLQRALAPARCRIHLSQAPKPKHIAPSIAASFHTVYRIAAYRVEHAPRPRPQRAFPQSELSSLVVRPCSVPVALQLIFAPHTSLGTLQLLATRAAHALLASSSAYPRS
ncbi:hypothetical protein B0H17DRAFT_1197398 [Mycena rosella]|uniref:Uncharacterized protein n=1 Tax=Mycena rosella TaxID=1033263 RepID=A0AAD7GNG7_MYCRO|nr:hypothetical protein B0H17DRAFT_1197398 [Mycena rosella]